MILVCPAFAVAAASAAHVHMLSGPAFPAGAGEVSAVVVIVAALGCFHCKINVSSPQQGFKKKNPEKFS